MSQRIVRLTVYKSRANAVTLFLKERAADGTETDVDFSSVSKMVLTLNPNGESPVTVDSAVDSNSIDYSTNGQVVFTIGETTQVKAMSEDLYEARLTATDGLGNKTELLNEDGPQRVLFAIRDTSTLP